MEQVEINLINDKEKARIEANKPLLDDSGNQVGSWLPVSTPEPSWWVVESCDPDRCVPYAITPDGRFRPEPRITPNEAIKYLTRSLNFKVAEFELNNYRCDDNSNPSWCQHAQQAGGYIGRIGKMIKTIKQAQQKIAIENNTPVDIPEPASPASSPVVEQTVEKTVSYLPIVVGGLIALVIVILLLRRKKNG